MKPHASLSLLLCPQEIAFPHARLTAGKLLGTMGVSNLLSQRVQLGAEEACVAMLESFDVPREGASGARGAAPAPLLDFHVSIQPKKIQVIVQAKGKRLERVPNPKRSLSSIRSVLEAGPARMRAYVLFRTADRFFMSHRNGVNVIRVVYARSR